MLLQHTYMHHPANTAIFFLKAQGVECADNFGKDCIGLSKSLKHAIISQMPGIEVSYLVVPDDGHHCVLAESPEGDKYLLDPMFMQAHAVLIPRIPGSVAVDTFGGQGKLVMEKGPDGLLHINWYSFMPHNRVWHLLHAYELDLLRDKRKHAPRIRRDLFEWDGMQSRMHIRVAKLSLRVFSDSKEKIVYVSDVQREQRYFYNRLNQKIGEHDKAGYGCMHRTMLASLHITQQQFVGFMHDAITAYHDFFHQSSMRMSAGAERVSAGARAESRRGAGARTCTSSA